MLFLGTYFTITPADVASTTAIAGNLVGDFMPFLVVILGVLIGAFVIKVILHLKD